MNILLLAPHPFYQERGTPIAVDMLLRVLDEDGIRVDMVTFQEGADRAYDRVHIHRIDPPGAVSSVRPGFSLKKLYCDLWLFARAWRLLWRNRYDAIHAVEESGFMAWFLNKLFRVPYIYDMDSMMSDQLMEKYPALKSLRAPMQWLEKIPMRNALAVAPMCEDLARHARIQNQRVFVLKDVSLISDDTARSHVATEDLRRSLNIPGPMLLYVGNLEPYQGIELLLRAVAHLVTRDADVQLVIIGGIDADIERYQSFASECDIAGRVHFLGTRPVDRIGEYLRQADVLVSPRIQGTNTPMKIYSYLHSGTPVVATNLPTHTQVLNSSIAVLAEPEPAAFAEAIGDLIAQSERRRSLGDQARHYAQREHSLEGFKKNVRELYDSVREKVS
ncbi:MAG: glycosyltransferase family 4 protein [Gammaproteobacteria bacterium]|nr:glycosyltransferase family 4 protein [Gammaproteobacteria bacterium]